MFRTELIVAPTQQQLPRTARVLTIGSCFADSIGSRLTDNKVTTLVNPFGTVFQPLAVAQLLRAAAGEDVDWQQHVVEARGRWQSLDLHSSIGADSPVELLQTIGEKVYNTGTFLRQADVVVLTLGSAWAYRSLASGELVSNCQKLPAERFEKELLTPDDIINALAETHAYLRRLNPKLRFVLTVSPVRHLKDTLPLNAVSKSVLRVACHYISELLPDVSYFPAFELLTDDLRDYRFYGTDMLHPTEVAEDYVWDKFARTYFDADFGRFRKEWAAVRQALLHRPLHDGAPEHRQFLESTRERLEQLAAQGVPVGCELTDVQQRVEALPEPITAAPTLAEPEDDGQERIDIDDRAGLGTATPAPALPTTEPDGRAPRTGRSRGGRNRNGRNRDEAAAREVLSVEMGAGVMDFVELAAAPATEEAPEARTATAPEVAAPFGEADEMEYPAKKKKRRSRGGAKRTARKHAALAVGATTPEEPINDDQADLFDGVTVAANPGAGSADGSTTQRPADEAEPRRSSVITKSVPVKRGGRNRRGGRGETPLTADTAASVALPVLADILPPVMPVVMEPAATLPAEAETRFATVPAAEPAPEAPASAPVRGKQRLLFATPADTAASETKTGATAAPAAISLAEQVLGLKPKSQQSLSELYGEPRAATPAAVPRWQRPVLPAKVRPQVVVPATPMVEPAATPTPAPDVHQEPAAEQAPTATVAPAPRRKPAGKAQPAAPAPTATVTPAAKAKPGKVLLPKAIIPAISSGATATRALPGTAATPAAAVTASRKAAAPKAPAKPATPAAQKTPAAPAAATAKAGIGSKPTGKAASKSAAQTAITVTAAPTAAKAKKTPVAVVPKAEATATKMPGSVPKKLAATPKLSAASTSKPTSAAPKAAALPAKASAAAAKGLVAASKSSTSPAKETAPTPKVAVAAAKAKVATPKAATAATGRKPTARKAPPKAK